MSLTEAEAREWIVQAAEGLSKEVGGFGEISECTEISEIKIQVEVTLKSNESRSVMKHYQGRQYEPDF